MLTFFPPNIKNPDQSLLQIILNWISDLIQTHHIWKLLAAVQGCHQKWYLTLTFDTKKIKK